MANPHKGEVEFKAGADTFKMSFSADALTEAENALGMTVNQISTAMQNPETFRIGMVRTLFWAGLLDCHDGELDMPGARKIFRRMTVNEAIAVIGKGFALAFAEPAEGGGAATDPQKPVAPAADGTGAVS